MNRLLLAALLLAQSASAMVFKSDRVDAHWDTWTYEHEGTYYLYYLITEYGPGEGFGVATSKDGVHWRDHGWALRQSDQNAYYLGTGAVWKAPDFATSKKFICNYSEHRREANGQVTQHILFAWSTDLLHWTKYDDSTMFNIDPEHYVPTGRWDCIFPFPRKEGGYWGTWTASGKAIKGTIGIGTSDDGLHWTALPPPVVTPRVGESGAIYPVDGRYYGMFGEAGEMLSYRADVPTGPYTQPPKNAQFLRKGPTYFSRFLPTKDALLVNHHSMCGLSLRRRAVTYLAPFKEAVVDAEGVMRWKYWRGNEALKGNLLPVETTDTGRVRLLARDLDLNVGLVMEAKVALPQSGEKPATVVFQIGQSLKAVRLLEKGVVEMGSIDATGTRWEPSFAVDRQWTFPSTAKLRVLVRAGMMEVYLDDHFIECRTLGCYGQPSVRPGLLLDEAGHSAVSEVKLWAMTLQPAKTPPPEQSYPAQATASSAATDAALAVDGNPATGWTGATDGSAQWLQLDLGASKRIDRLVLHWGPTAPAGYSLEISPNGTDWSKVHSNDAPRPAKEPLDNRRLRARFLRLNLPPGSAGVQEVQAFGRPENPATTAAPDIVLATFEDADFGDWKIEGDAFGTKPARSNFKGQHGVTGIVGKQFANSFAGKADASKGKLTSPYFHVARRYLNFLIGGGNQPGKTCVNVLLNGKVLATATASNADPLEWRTLDLWDGLGKQVQVEIVDDSAEPWGHINVDQVLLTDSPISEVPQRKETTVSKPILNVPVYLGSSRARQRMTVKVDGTVLGHFQVALAGDKPDSYCYLDLSAHLGRALSIEVNRFTHDLSGLTLDDRLKGGETLYAETYRPQFHFTAQRGWLNDPNGLIFYQGVYHLYYQYNPFAPYWGNMSWGHATSTDLVHWKEQPAVLYPNAQGDCFSGAAFIDRRNQLGQQTGRDDVLVAFYLRTKIGLALAYSNDRGQTFTDFAGNPVLNHEGARIDTPRPFWFEPTGRWVAPTYDFFTDPQGKKLRCVGFYSSANLKDWVFESRVEQDKWGDELCGCVDFFQLPVDGDPGQRKWVMVFIDGSYIVGSFDGRTFLTLDGKPASTQDRIRSLVIDRNYYATMTWENVPGDRRVQVTWMKGGSYPGMPFSQQLTVPVEVTLHSTTEGPRLRLNPIHELATLRRRTHEFKDVALAPKANPLAGIDIELIDLETEFAPGTDSETVFELRGVKVRYDAAAQKLFCDKAETTLAPVDGKIRLRILVDRTSIEVFANDGRVYLPVCLALAPENRSLAAGTTRGEAHATSLRVHELTSIWPKPSPE